MSKWTLSTITRNSRATLEVVKGMKEAPPDERNVIRERVPEHTTKPMCTTVITIPTRIVPQRWVEIMMVEARSCVDFQEAKARAPVRCGTETPIRMVALP